MITELSKESQAANKQVEDVSLLDFISNNINAAIDSLDIDKRVEQLKIEADNLMSHIIDLIIVFTMQTIFLPLVFVWLSMKLLKASFTFRFFN